MFCTSEIEQRKSRPQAAEVMSSIRETSDMSEPVNRPIYLDYMATTPTDPEVVAKMQQCLEQSGCFGNPASSTHRYGWEARALVEQAREQVAALINADPREIVWTSGATEADNLAIKGVAEFYQRKGRHLITMSTEHKAVLDTYHYLADQGFDVTFLDPQQNGLLDLKALQAAIRSDTILVSVMHVNNETGVIQDIAKIAEITRANGVLFHVDAAQGVGKVAIDLKQMQVDLMSFSGHKLYGPKGIGALYVRRNPRVRLAEQMHGGGHERGMRSGTLATHQIVGMGEAFAIARQRFAEDVARITALRNRLWDGINEIDNVHINGDRIQHVCSCLNLSFDGISNESLILALRNLAISTGSACSSANSEPSYVLLAMDLPKQRANNAVRISIGRLTTEKEVDFAIQEIKKEVKRLRQLSPLVNDHKKL